MLDIKYFDLFAGIGGFSLGMSRINRKKNGEGKKDSATNAEAGERLVSSQRERIGSENRRFSQQPYSDTYCRTSCVGFSELDRYAAAIYRYQFPEHKGYGDATKITWADVPDFDLLCAGFPCQAFSIAGKRRGFDDTRGTLFFEIVRCAQEKQPRLLLLENVKGLLSHDAGRTFGTILNTLDECGYDLQWQVLNSKDFGVPQNRERVFVIGHSRRTPRPEVFPVAETNGRTDERIYEATNCRALCGGGHSGGHHSAMTLIIQKHQDWRQQGDGLRQYEATAPAIRANMGDNMPMVAIKGDLLTREKPGRQYGFSDKNMFTLRKAVVHGIMDNSCIRRLTVIECERLQSFPDNWTQYGDFGGEIKPISDTQRYKCLGNAITVNVVEWIIEQLQGECA